VVAVHHELTQTLFEEALEHAKHRAAKHSMLLLHCNYNSPFADNEATLNLTREKAEDLLKHFEYILAQITSDKLLG
jgi:EAL domain-containing protein (putative c-di-GMP-specific phosphodiesterase class I)